MSAVSEERRREVEERASKNEPLIEEYRATQGRAVGSQLLLLHHFGARTGIERVNPVAYRKKEENFVVSATNAGRPANPDWYYNLVSHPRTTIEVTSETIEVVARVLSGEERAIVWEQQKAETPAFVEFEQTAPREIPVVLLERL